MEELLLQNEDLLFAAAGVRCVIGKVRSARFDRCKVQQLQPKKMLAMCHSRPDVQYQILGLLWVILVRMVLRSSNLLNHRDTIQPYYVGINSCISLVIVESF